MKRAMTFVRPLHLICVAVLLLAPPVQAESNGEQLNAAALERLKRLRKVEPTPSEAKKGNIFSAKSWYVPPKPTPTPLPTPTPPPSAPPLPFTFLGQQEAKGKLTLFLSSGNQLYLVTQGDTIDNTYSVDGIVDGKLGLTYLPLNIKQFLSVGETP